MLLLASLFVYLPFVSLFVCLSDCLVALAYLSQINLVQRLDVHETHPFQRARGCSAQPASLLVNAVALLQSTLNSPIEDALASVLAGGATACDGRQLGKQVCKLLLLLLLLFVSRRKSFMIIRNR